MKFILKICCDNAAFTSSDGRPSEEARNEEVARILREAADRIASDYTFSPGLRDYNGNNVGTFVFTEE